MHNNVMSINNNFIQGRTYCCYLQGGPRRTPPPPYHPPPLLRAPHVPPHPLPQTHHHPQVKILRIYFLNMIHLLIIIGIKEISNFLNCYWKKELRELILVTIMLL